MSKQITINSLGALKDTILPHSFLSSDDMTKLYKQLPKYDTVFLQTAAVTVKSKNGSSIIPTLLSFDRTSKVLALSSFASLVNSIRYLSNANLTDPPTYDQGIKQYGRLMDYDPYLHVGYTPYAHNKVLFMIIYPMENSKKRLIAWKSTPWSTDECKSFLSDKGFLKMPRYHTS